MKDFQKFEQLLSLYSNKMAVLEGDALLLSKLQEIPKCAESSDSEEEEVKSLNFVMIVNPRPKYEDLCNEYKVH